MRDGVVTQYFEDGGIANSEERFENDARLFEVGATFSHLRTTRRMHKKFQKMKQRLRCEPDFLD